METQSMLVVPVGEEREFNMYISSQWPAMVQVRRSALTSSYSERHKRLKERLAHSVCKQEVVAQTLDIPSNRVTCHVKRVGGAFGGKITKTPILAGITSVAAWK